MNTTPKGWTRDGCPPGWMKPDPTRKRPHVEVVADKTAELRAENRQLQSAMAEMMKRLEKLEDINGVEPNTE